MPRPENAYCRVLEPSKGLFTFNWRELWDYRDLVYFLYRRYLHTAFHQTRLGPLWFLLHPLMASAIFVIVFNKTLGVSTHGVPAVLFYLCGLLFWRYFAYTFLRISASLTSNASLLGKVYFPRITIPLALLFANLVTLGAQIILFGCVYAGFVFFTLSPAFGINLPLLFLLPAALGLLMATTLGLGLWVAALTVKHRDLQHVLDFLVNLLMYATPVIYPVSSIPAAWRHWAGLNPLSTLVEFSRILFLGSGNVSWWDVSLSTLVSLSVLATGVFVFSRAEKTFVDTL